MLRTVSLIILSDATVRASQQHIRFEQSIVGKVYKRFESGLEFLDFAFFQARRSRQDYCLERVRLFAKTVAVFLFTWIFQSKLLAVRPCSPNADIGDPGFRSFARRVKRDRGVSCFTGLEVRDGNLRRRDLDSGGISPLSQAGPWRP